MNPIAFITSAVRRVRERYDAACDKVEAQADAEELRYRDLTVKLRKSELDQLEVKRDRASTDSPDLNAAMQAKRDELARAQADAARARLKLHERRAAEILQRPD